MSYEVTQSAIMQGVLQFILARPTLTAQSSQSYGKQGLRACVRATFIRLYGTVATKRNCNFGSSICEFNTLGYWIFQLLYLRANNSAKFIV